MEKIDLGTWNDVAEDVEGLVSLSADQRLQEIVTAWAGTVSKMPQETMRIAFELLLAHGIMYGQALGRKQAEVVELGRMFNNGVN